MSYSVIPFINCAVNSTGPIIYFVRYLGIAFFSFFSNMVWTTNKNNQIQNAG